VARLRFQVSISLDGFIAGPNPSEEHPLGEGGMQLHQWAFKLAVWCRPHGQEGGETNASSAVVEESLDNIGATVMGRRMFGEGTRQFEKLSVSDVALEQIQVVEVPSVAHLKYRVAA
jgi:dihydrofolate reductase